MSGYAWSSSAGWISLNKNDLSLVSNCESSENPVPRIIYTSPSDIKLQGCALVLLNGEVINFSGTTTGGVDYGLLGSVETTENPNLTLHSCAWSDSLGGGVLETKQQIGRQTRTQTENTNHRQKLLTLDNITLNTSITATDTLALFGKNIGINWDCGAPEVVYVYIIVLYWLTDSSVTLTLCASRQVPNNESLHSMLNFFSDSETT